MFSKYRYVCALDEERNFTRAAKKLFISQPSLSAAIKNLETDLGAPLFERMGASIEPTDVGKAYIEAAKKMKQAEEDFQEKLNDIHGLETGVINIGGTNYLSSSYIMPAIIERFLSVYPKIKINLVEASSSKLNEYVADDRIDIVMDSIDEYIGSYKGYPITEEKILLAVPKSNPINKKLKDCQISPDDIYHDTVDLNRAKRVSLKEFANESFILLSNGNDMYNRAINMFKEADISPEIKFSVDQLSVSYALASSGSGICFTSDMMFKYTKYKNKVVLYAIDTSDDRRTLYIAHKKTRYCNRAMAKFIETAREIVK